MERLGHERALAFGSLACRGLRHAGSDATASLPARGAGSGTAPYIALCRGAQRFLFAALAHCALDLRGPEELSLLPFTYPSDVRNWRDFLCVSQGDVRRMVTLETSGTTSKPKRLAFTQGDLARPGFFRRHEPIGKAGPAPGCAFARARNDLTAWRIFCGRPWLRRA